MTDARDLIVQSAPLLAQGCVYTLSLSLFGMGAGLILGLGLALMRLSRFWLVRFPAGAFISVIRGTPLLVQLFLIYYGLPQFGIELPPLIAAGIGFSVNLSAYAAEILRGSLQAVDPGQQEAAAALGFTPQQTLWRILLPQAARTAIAPLSNSFVSLIKDTSLAATIQVPELFRQAQLITARTFEIFTLYLTAAALYWIASTLLSQGQSRLEAWAARGRR